MSNSSSHITNIAELPREKFPRHIAIIMDGNGRWAQRRNLPRFEGHRAGARTVERVVLECSALGLECLTLYSFSIENWSRPAEEVEVLMSLCSEYLSRERHRLIENNVRLVHLGRRDRIPEHSLQELDYSAEVTAGNTGMTLCLALNYGGRTELVDAFRRIAEKVKSGQVLPEQIDEAMVSDHLYTADLPDPDLLIRTAGEQRISNFLLWQISYAEFYIADVCWPDFTIEHLHKAILDYAGRERKFGKVPANQKR